MIDLTDAEAWVLSSEEAFTEQLTNCAELLCHDPELRILTITGPTCSGKTTASRLLSRHFEDCGRRVIPMSVDDFYKNKTDMPLLPDGRQDFDSAASIDLPYLSHFLDWFLAGKPVALPHFDFVTGERTEYQVYRMEQGDVLLLEGIQTMYPEVQSFFPDRNTRSAAIEPVVPGDSPLSSRDVRLLRRIVRDIRERGTEAEATLAMWDAVAANEDRSILPYLPTANLHINSYLAYELSVIRPFAENALSGIGDASPYAADRDRLLSGLSGVAAIDAALVPADSLFREFIGSAGL